MINYKRINNICGWIVFAIAACVYMKTNEPTVSFWDCGEFISTGFKLEVGHQPGAPLFLMMTKVFSTIFTGNNNLNYAHGVNTFSSTVASLAILFLFWTITAFAKKLLVKRGDEVSTENLISIMGAGVVGALAFTFTDSFWFSATEGIVWSSSFCFTSIVFWSIMKWEANADDKHAIKYLVFIAFLIGLSIGVHLLNLLTIPAITAVFYFRKNPKDLDPAKAGKWIIFIGIIMVLTVWLSLANLAVIVFIGILYMAKSHKSMKIIVPLLAGMALVGFVQFRLIPGVIKLAAFFDLMFVNDFHMGFGSGVMFYFLLGLAAIVFGLIYTKKHNMPEMNTIILCLSFIVLGYSSYSMTVIRANASTPLNEGDPEDVFSLQGYLGREQYGEWPVLYGQYYNAKYVDSKESGDIYIKDTTTHSYKSVGKKQTAVYDPEYCTYFPRMHSSEPNHIRGYKDWAGIKGDRKPTFGENLTFFWGYQFKFMYWRYFFWNFVGRQNDIQGYGEISHGNWISGIPFIDSMWAGSQDKLPQNELNNKGRHKYYFLPLILGLMGAYYAYKKNWKDGFIITYLFFFLGLAIILFLNQTPYQPRERDYSYAASYWAFSIFLGLGVLQVIDLLRKGLKNGVNAGLLSIGLCLVVPALLAKENWGDHDRSGRYTARDFSYDYLNSCAPNAILFTGGDNDTFPLWYEQEVEGVRTDVRVIVTSLYNTDWYINTTRHKYYDDEPVPYSTPPIKYVTGTRDYVPYQAKIKGAVELKDFIAFITSDDPETKVMMGNKQEMNYFPTKKIKITIDSANIMNNHVVDPEEAGKIVKEMDFEFKDNYLMKGHMMCLDMIATNNWKRPVYFAVSMENSDYLGLEDYFQLEGLTYRLVPVKHAKTPDQQPGGVNTRIMYDNMVNKFRWGGMEGGKIYLDDKIRNMTINLRNNFERLAEALLAEGKKDSAIKALDKCVEVIPETCVPYDIYMIRAADQYYRAGAIDKADKLVKRLSEIYQNDLAYYVSLKGSDAAAYDRDRQQAQAVLGELDRMTKEYKPDPNAKPANIEAIPDSLAPKGKPDSNAKKPNPVVIKKKTK